jgi:hypothetical protein
MFFILTFVKSQFKLKSGKKITKQLNFVNFESLPMYELFIPQIITNEIYKDF